jgi:hypothetical protein
VIIGEKDEPRGLEHLVDDESIDIEFRSGYLRGLSTNDSGKADEHLRTWLAREWFADLIYAVSVLDATPVRAGLAVEASRRSHAVGLTTPALQRLAFGSWLVPLDYDAATSVIQQLVEDAERDRGFAAVDAASFSLWSYLGKKPPTESLLELGRRAVRLTEEHSQGPRRDLSYMRNQLADQIKLRADDRLEVTLRALGQRGFPSTEDVQALKALLPEIGVAAVERVFDWLLSQDFAVTLYIQDAGVLSIISEVLGEGPVLEELNRRPVPDRAKLLQHLNFREDIPRIAEALLETDYDASVVDELTRRFLYPGEVVMGPYSEYLTRRRVLLERRTDEGFTAKVRQWATQLLQIVDQMILDERLREEEERN